MKKFVIIGLGLFAVFTGVGIYITKKRASGHKVETLINDVDDVEVETVPIEVLVEDVNKTMDDIDKAIDGMDGKKADQQ